MRGIRILACLLTAAVLISAARVQLTAATATANLGVTATVLSTCIVGGATLGFGSYDPTSAANVDQSTTFQVTCTKGTGATVGMNLGTNASGSTRRMTDGTDFLSYELYKDSSRSQIWGNSGSDLLTLAAATSNAAQTVPVYGRIVGSQDSRAGSYNDTVVITVTFN